ncbi:MAG: hypothetical protein HYY35_08150 [Deltaproteobacteria bacterium]|nr:hypothetical protein [Deltaproteobacteria bacterium]
MRARSNVRVGAAISVAVLVFWSPPIAVGEDRGVVADLRREIEDVRRQMRALEEKLKQLEERAGAASAPPPAPPPAALAAVPAPPPRAPWSPAQPMALLSGARGYLNLSFDALVDFGWSTNREVTALQRGDHDPIERGFTLPNEEIFLDGAVDPYFQGVADIVFKLNEDNETEVELEEVYLTTASLPWNLQVKAGQFFTEFGRLNQQHPHAWDFVDQPLVIGRMLGPEGLRNPGARASWLAPTPFYSELFLAVQNSQGGTAFSFRNTEEAALFGRPAADRPVRGPWDLLLAPRYVASFDLSDSQALVAGLSGAFGPNASGTSTRTQIYGGDLYWKWKPAWQSGGFPFLSWQTELLGRRYEAGAAEIRDPAAPDLPPLELPRESLYDWGLYSQVLYGFTQRWVAGLRGDWVTGGRGAFRPDENRADRYRIAPNLTFHLTEFSKIRLQYDYDHGQILGSDSSVWTQVEFLLGAHAAHKF